MIGDETAKRGRGRPRKGDTAANAQRRKDEALRLEAERDAAATEWERTGAASAKAHMCAVEQRLASAWAAALRSEGKVTAAMRYSDAAVKWAAAHAKALDQLLVDEVADLAAKVERRERAERAAGP